MFEGGFLEAQELAVNLEEMEFVISARSIEALIHWLCLRVVRFDIQDTTEHLTAAVEFVRLADKYCILDLEQVMNEYIGNILIGASNPDEWPTDNWTRFLSTEHIISSSLLSQDHPVRRTLVAASVMDYLGREKYKFVSLTEDCPAFATDLLREVHLTLHQLVCRKNACSSKDPLSGELIMLQFRSSADEQ